jgi:hypothetical protein
MLEVHAPNQSCLDRLSIHIATIAVGLEQAVDSIRHRTYGQNSGKPFGVSPSAALTRRFPITGIDLHGAWIK